MFNPVISPRVLSGTDPHWYDVTDEGARGDGKQNDSIEINNAITKARAAGGGTVYVPYGEAGIYLLGGPITLYDNVSFVMASSTQLRPYSGYGGDAVVFSPSQSYTNRGERYLFSRIADFHGGAGIRLQDGTHAAQVWFEEIGYCKYGVWVDANGTVGIYNSAFRFHSIRGCDYAIYLRTEYGETATKRSEIQGCLFSGAVIIDCRVAIHLEQGTNDYNGGVSSNTFDINLINGSGGMDKGIVFSKVRLISGNVFKSAGSFGQFLGGHIAAENGGSADGQYFELAIWTVNTSTYAAYEGIRGSNILKVLGQSTTVTRDTAGKLLFSLHSGMIRNVGPDPNLAHWVHATQTHNNRSGFNGGIPLFFQRVAVLFAMPAMSVGDTADFYVYSPFTTGTLRQPKFFPQEVVAQVCAEIIEDESRMPGRDGNQADNQVHLRFRAFNTVSAGQTIVGVIEFAS